MRSLLLLIGLSAYTACGAINMDIIKDIHQNKYHKAEEKISKLLEGKDEDVIEGCLHGLYFALQTNNKEEMIIYFCILENMLHAMDIRGLDYQLTDKHSAKP